MDTREREAKITEIIKAAERMNIGPACVTCRFARDANYSALGYCRNPVAKLDAIVSTQSVSTSSRRKLTDMRSATGLCGPEALLYQRRMLFITPFWRQPTDGQAVLHAIPQIIFLVLIFLAAMTWVMA